MARQTAQRLEREGALSDAIRTSEKQAPQEQIDNAREIAQQKFQDSSDRITPEDKARAAERHAASSRAGGDDRPSYATRRGYCDKLVTEFGDGKTCPCVYCGRTLVGNTVSLDRLVPGVEGGPYRMPNLAPSCYDCNNWRGDTPFQDAMQKAVTGAADNDKPIIPLGTLVTANCSGYSAMEHDPSAPVGIPVESVSGTLDGYFVQTFGYYKYIVAGLDVIADSMKVDDNAVAQSSES